MFRTIRAFLRLFTIARVLARHDALALVEEQGFAKPVVHLARWLSGRRQPGRSGEKLARACTDLGPSFIKLGQFISTRADLVGETMAADLAELQDHLPPFETATARATIESELGAPVAALFAEFDDVPKSAASIAQVHMATTTEGRRVAVKVLRPGIERAFDRDLALLYWIADLAERAQPRLRRLKPTALVGLFEEQVRIEMDLSLEAAAAHELAENFAGDPSYNVPEVDWQRTAPRVFTAGRIAGIRIDDREGLIAAGHDLDVVLERAAAVFFKQVFRDGFFHGDQHPGNMFIDDAGNVVAVDFGIMGRLDRPTRYFLADMLLALLDRDYHRLARVFVAAGYLPRPDGPSHSLPVFAQALRAISEPVFGQPLREISFAKLLGQMFRLSESFQMEVQPQLLLLQKNMMMAEGVSRSLNPDLNTWQLAAPLIEEWMRENRGPEARLRDTARDWWQIAGRLPETLGRVETLIADVERGGLRLNAGSGGGSANGWLKLAVALSAAALVLAGVAVGVGLG
jgi:ubiquinone biosynthesis protein